MPALSSEAFDKDLDCFLAHGSAILQPDGADDVHEQVGAPVAPTVANPPRREHRSAAVLENAHCSYCGARGHKMPTCQQLRRDLEEQSLGLLDAPGALILLGWTSRLPKLLRI